MVKQLSENFCLKQHIFATCRDPDGPKSEALRELARKHPSVITIIRLDADDPSSVKEFSKKVGSLLGNNSLNLLVNNAGASYKASLRALNQQFVLCHCGLQARGFQYCVTRTQIIKMIVFGEELVTGRARICEGYPYLQMAAKASGTPGMSSNKAAVISISTVAGSMTRMPSIYNQFPTLPYGVSKATLEPKESVEGMLCVIGSLTEKQHGGFLDYTGETIPW